MNNDPESLFNARRTTDERAFTARVMAEIYSRQPAKLSWPFLRWAAPALALSLASFTIAVAYSVRPDPVSAETLLLEDQEPEVSEAWLAETPETTTQIAPEVNS